MLETVRMQIKSGLCLFVIALSLVGCVDSNSLTQRELDNQNRVDAIVSGTLFEHELDSAASYNVRKNGFVVIKFDESVSGKKYTEVVKLLRSNPGLTGVRAEQSGREVCPLRF